MKRSISEMVSPRLEAPEGEVHHEAKRNQRPVDLRRLSHERFPKGAGKNLRQVAPVLDQKVLDDQSPVVPDKEVAEAVCIKDRCKTGDQQQMDQLFLHFS